MFVFEPLLDRWPGKELSSLAVTCKNFSCLSDFFDSISCTLDSLSLQLRYLQKLIGIVFVAVLVFLSSGDNISWFLFLLQKLQQHQIKQQVVSGNIQKKFHCLDCGARPGSDRDLVLH